MYKDLAVIQIYQKEN